MRHTIDTAPRDGEFVIIVDDASGRFDIAHWSASRAWIREDGEPSEIRPSHWNPISSEKYLAVGKPQSGNCHLGEAPLPLPFTPDAPPSARGFVAPNSLPAVEPVIPEPAEVQTATALPKHGPGGQRRFAMSIAIALIGVAIIGLYRHAEVAALFTEHPDLQNAFGKQIQLASQALPEPASSAPQPPAESDQTRHQAALQDGAKLPQAVEASVPKARQSLENNERLEALTNELADARRTIDAINLQLQAEATRAQSLEQERDKTAAVAQQATASLQQLAANAEQSRGALEEEKTRVAALTGDLAAARRDLDTQATLSSNAQDETNQLRLTTEATMAELRRSLQDERDKTASLARDLETALRATETRARPDHTASSPIAQEKSAMEPTAGEPRLKENPEVVRLMARASALLTQGNIGAARIVLERAVEIGDAMASFALAETYDPNVLASWGTYGTRGDASKARELYAKATAGGIRGAKDRINALHQ
jgi:predicted  nucleic acid-binding Zn-ribbon protein